MIELFTRGIHNPRVLSRKYAFVSSDAFLRSLVAAASHSLEFRVGPCPMFCA